MMTVHVMVLWLTLDGPMVETTVPDCQAAKAWYEQALRWAERSRLPLSEVGYLCDIRGTPMVLEARR